MPYTESKGVEIYYEIHGSGPAITLIHGSGGHHASWWQQVPYLAKNYTVILPDLRGFGLSGNVDKPDSLDFAHDIRAVLDHAEIEKSVFLGQSIGASPAVRLAMSDPDKVTGIILAHSLGGISDPKLKEMAAANRAEAVKLPVIDRLMSKHFQSSDPSKTWLFREMGTFNHAKMQDLQNLTAQGPSVEDINATGIPILLLAGEKDAVLWPETIKQAHKKLKNSTLSIVPNAPHSMYWEQPALFNAEVHKFLMEVYGQ